MVSVGAHLIDQGSLCLLDFINGLSKEEGPPLFLAYAPKTCIVSRKSVIGDATGWVIEHANNCQVVKVASVVIEHPVNTKKKKPHQGDNAGVGPEDAPVFRDPNVATYCRRGNSIMLIPTSVFMTPSIVSTALS